MNFLYIGQFSHGTTSRLRGSILQKFFPKNFKVIDTHIPFYKSNKVFRTLGFRYKKGPLVNFINSYVTENLNNIQYDVIWVDKAVFISEKTTRKLRSRTKNLIHFSPDPQFTFHQSRHFFKSGKYYDYLITTKSFEMDLYNKKFGSDKVIYATQGFDKDFHKPYPDLDKSGFCFIGHHEDDREQVIQLLIDNQIVVKLAGINWSKFNSKNQGNSYLIYLGEGIYGDDYVKTISSSKIAWGALSKWVDEQHTTRTFEIPACGTALITERNEEIMTFFDQDEVIYYDRLEDILSKVKFYLQNDQKLIKIANKGYKRVMNDGRDYEFILRSLLKKMEIL